MLLTNRWILEPTLEADLYGRNDAGREQGAGVADSEVGLRLRDEITHGFAPTSGSVSTACAARAPTRPWKTAKSWARPALSPVSACVF